MAAEEVHDHAPGDGGEDGPGVVGDGGRGRGPRHEGQAVAGLHGEAREGEHDAREDVDDDLLVHARDLARAPRALAEDEVAAHEAGEEVIVRAWIFGKGERLAVM